MWAIAINPTAGSGKGAEIGRQVAGYFASRRLEYCIVTGSKATLLRNALDSFLDTHACEGVISVGGDGLAHLILQSVVPRKTPFAIIAAGTGNDFARAIGWPFESIEMQLDFITTNPSTPIDLGLVDSEWFGAILSTGFDSLVNERANSMTWPKGPAKYNVAIARELSRFQPLPYVIDLDGHQLSTQAMLIAVANGSYYGAGMKVCPDASLHDGLFDVMVISPISKIEFMRVFPSVFSGTHVNHHAVSIYRSRKVSIMSDAIAYADGERIGQLPVRAECISNAGLSWSL
jgi:diacylglycerol kinase (ATP)